MKPTTHIGPLPAPNGCRAAARSALWVLGPLAVAVALSLVLTLAGAATHWMGAAWLAAVLWAIAASFVQAMWQGLRHGDWSAFTCCDLPGHDEDLDFATKTGKYAYLRIRADHEALMRESDRFLKDHDHNNSRP